VFKLTNFVSAVSFIVGSMVVCVGQSVLVSDTHLDPATNFSPSLIILDTYGFVDVECPL
jgi:hypothetical protein